MNPEEWLKNLRYYFGRHTDTAVLNRNRQTVGRIFPIHCYSRFIRTILNRIIEQIIENVRQVQPVGQYVCVNPGQI